MVEITKLQLLEMLEKVWYGKQDDYISLNDLDDIIENFFKKQKNKNKKG